MKGTSSEDDRAIAKEKKEGDKESELEAKEGAQRDQEGIHGDKEGVDQEGADQEGVDQEVEKAKTAVDLLEELPEVYGGEKFLLGVFSKFGDKDPLKITQR